MHHLKRSPCTMAAASMHNLAGHGAQFRRKRCAKAAELSPRLLHTLDAEVEHPRRRNWTENDTGSHCPEHWLWGAGTVALTRRTPGSEASEYSPTTSARARIISTNLLHMSRNIFCITPCNIHIINFFVRKRIPDSFR